METLRSRIIELLSDGDTGKALKVLDEELIEKNHPLHSKLVIINGEYSDVTENLSTNVIGNEEAQRSKNRINKSIIDILDEMDGKEVKNPKDQDSEQSPIKSKLKLGLILAVVGCLVIVIITLFIVLSDKMNESSNDNPDSITKPEDRDSTLLDDGIDTVQIDEFIRTEFEESDVGIDYDEIVADLVINDLGLKIYNEYKDVYLHQQLTDSVHSGVFIDKKAEVRSETRQLVRKLNYVKDDSLELYSKIYKHIGLMISNKILALISNRSSDQIEFTTEAFSHIKSLYGFIDEIKEIEDGEYQNEMQNWIDDEKYESRILVNKFICMAVNFKAEGVTKKEEIVKLYNQMEQDNDIIRREGYHIYPIIKWLFEKEIVEHKH